jgi:hypothetical protein
VPFGDVPSVGEFVPGYDVTAWYGVGALSPADFGKFVADETEKWGKVVRALNIKAG